MKSVVARRRLRVGLIGFGAVGRVVGEALANGCAGDCQLEAILARLIVYADPSVQRNVHEIRVRGAVGDIQIEVRNAPSENPKTSQIVALSAVRAIRDLTAPVVIGA